MTGNDTPNAEVEQQVADAYLAAVDALDTDRELACEQVNEYLQLRFIASRAGIDLSRLFSPPEFEDLAALDIGFGATVDADTLGDAFEQVIAGFGTKEETGSYYTPDYITDYIVEETAHPLIQSALDDVLESPTDTVTEALNAVDPSDAEEALAAIDDLSVLDPACGSGDFAVRALEEVEHARRRIWQLHPTEDVPSAYVLRKRTAERNIYAVDLQPEAVEMAKLRLRLRILEVHPGPAGSPIVNLAGELTEGVA